MQTSDAMRRENTKVCQPSLRAQRSNPCSRKECIASLRSQRRWSAHTLPTLLRRQRQTNIAISTITNPTTIAPLMNRPPGRSMVRDRSEGASPGRASRNATTLSPIVVPDSE